MSVTLILGHFIKQFMNIYAKNISGTEYTYVKNCI